LDAKYSRRFDRRNPGCLLFLLDQSGSMSEPMAGTRAMSKADGVAHAVNDLLLTIVRRCVKDAGQSPRHYYDIGVIGYGNEALPLLTGPLTGRKLASVGEIADAVLRVEDRGEGPLPVWFEPVAKGRTAMCSALEMAGRVASGWVRAHPGSFPPIIINISDGKPTDGDPTIWSERIRKLHTNNGNVLLFNINLSSGASRPISFPAVDDDLPDDYSGLLFHMSSELPEIMREQARAMNIPIASKARGFVCNADMSAVIRALEIGTSLESLEEY